MKRSFGAAAAAAILAAFAGTATCATAALASVRHVPPAAPGGIANAVFVQTNNPAGNQILAYSRSADGTLGFAGSYDTGGDGVAIGGAVVDKLASQGSLVYDPAGKILVVVNGGSNTITTFAVTGDRLGRRHILAAGDTPVSIAVSGDLAYVLDAGGTGAVVGFRLVDQHLVPIEGSARGLGLTAGATPPFLNTPGQVGFSPDGSQLIVTTKANGSDIDVFSVGRRGLLGAGPVVNASATPVPFAFLFDHSGRLIVTEAGASTLSSYAVDGDGTLTHGSSVADGQGALCWVTEARGFFFGANAASADISGFTESSLGQLSLIPANSGVAGTTDAGTIDMAASSSGAFLYAQAGGAGSIDEFAVNSDGTLTSIGSITGLGGTGMEGIVAA